jgi:hypothetical protein
MGTKSAPSRQDRLAALRDKIAKTDLRTGGGGFFSPPDGRSVIRILPEVGKMTFFYQQVGTHMLPGSDNKKQFYCPNFTSEGEMDCPICDYVEELKKAGDKASVALASQLRVKRKFWMNVIDRDHEGQGPQIFTPGVMVFGQISSLIGDPDYGDIFDVEDGIDLIIEKKGQKLETEYQVKPKRTSTPLSDDPDTVKEWLDKARDLTPVEVSDNKEEDAELTKGHILFVLPYDRLEREFLASESDDEEAEDDDEAPRKSSKVQKVMKAEPDKKAKVLGKKRVVEEDEEDLEEEDLEEDDEVEDDDDDDGKSVKQEVATRSVRRHLRPR